MIILGSNKKKEVMILLLNHFRQNKYIGYKNIG